LDNRHKQIQEPTVSITKEELIQGLRAGARETNALFTSLTPEQLDTPVYTDGAQWTARQVLAHLTTIETSMHWLFRNILEGGPGSPEDFDVERFNRTQPRKLDGLSMRDLMIRFEEVRGETVRMVQNMSEQDLDRQGRHAFHGQGRLGRFIRWAYEHARIHGQDVRRALSITDTVLET